MEEEKCSEQKKASKIQEAIASIKKKNRLLSKRNTERRSSKILKTWQLKLKLRHKMKITQKR